MKDHMIRAIRLAIQAIQNPTNPGSERQLDERDKNHCESIQLIFQATGSNW